MKASRKIENTQRRIRKNTEREISIKALEDYKERTKNHKPKYIKIDDRTWKEVK